MDELTNIDANFLKEVRELLKKSLGDLNEDANMNSFYDTKITMAYSDLQGEDISETMLTSQLGKTTLVVYATLLIEDKDTATNPSLINLRNKLSDMTKGERYKNV